MPQSSQYRTWLRNQHIQHNAELERMLSFWHTSRVAKQHQPLISGRRHVKGKASGTLQVLKNSFVKPQVSIERVF